MKLLFSFLITTSFVFGVCPDGFYEDDCGTCWMPYCYDFNSHNIQYDIEESECSGYTQLWIIPGDAGDPFFNSYCNGSCPENFLPDDCNHCWMNFCYSFFQDGLDGDPAHSVYYDLTQEECESYGYGYYFADHPANPYWNSNCVTDCAGDPNGDAVEDCNGVCDGDALVDDCDECQLSYCYDYVTHEVNYDFPCDGPTEMYVAADDPSNPYWNSSCNPDDECDGTVDCAGVCDGYAMVDDCGVCSDNYYCYDYVTHQTNTDFPCDGATEVLVLPDSDYNADWNASCEDCNGVANGDALVDDCDECQLSYCYDYVTHEVNYDFPCDGPTEMYVAADDPSNPYWNMAQDCNGECGGDAVIDECGVCGGTGIQTGDLNDDCMINVLDIVFLVQIIVNGETFEDTADLNNDGTVNILDVVQLVGYVINGSMRSSDASAANMTIADNALRLSANGYIGGVQMTLSHANGFELDLTENAMVSEYKTNGTTTILVVVAPEKDLIFTANQSFEVVDMIVANSEVEIDVQTISEFGLSAAYPNPFNPSTTVELAVPTADFVSVKVYNLVGQVVGVLAEGMMEANSYTFSWNAADMASGVYLIRAESGSSVDIQKVLLVK